MPKHLFSPTNKVSLGRMTAEAMEAIVLASRTKKDACIALSLFVMKRGITNADQAMGIAEVFYASVQHSVRLHISWDP